MAKQNKSDIIHRILENIKNNEEYVLKIKNNKHKVEYEKIPSSGSHIGKILIENNIIGLTNPKQKLIEDAIETKVEHNKILSIPIDFHKHHEKTSENIIHKIQKTPKDLQDCIDIHLNSHILKKTTSIKHEIDKISDSLIIHLQRLKHNPKNNSTKIHKKEIYPNETIQIQAKNKKKKFKLKSVILCLGDDHNNIHYVTYRLRKNKKWGMFDDDKKPVEFKNFKQIINNELKEHKGTLKDRGYIFLYKKPVRKKK